MRLNLKLGQSWFAPHLRRAIQVLSLAAFFVLFFLVCWPYGSRHHADAMAAREMVDAEAFLALDPLVGISSAAAARAWVRPLAWGGVALAVCLVVPRAFCGWVCPLGTLIGLFDWAAGKRMGRARVKRRGWWVHLRYYILLGVLVAAGSGVLLTGFVAAIPVVTRGLLFVLSPVQLGLLRGWYLVPPMHAGYYVSIVLFLLVFALGLLGPRFWCRYVCPSGAVFSLVGVLRLTDRKVRSSCIRCGKCSAACPFDAVRADFTTRPAACTFCQTCGGACPVGAIEFVGRWTRLDQKPKGEPPAGEVAVSRRGLLAGAVCGGAAALGIRGASAGEPFVRPPGSLSEQEFLRRCVRCGECMKACPFNVLQPAGVDGGLASLWTPRVAADWAGCDPTCANCGQVCPTGAIRPLPLEEKRVVHMGLAEVNKATCLPHAGREACQFCFDECKAAGYDAVELYRIPTEFDEEGSATEGYPAPVIAADACVGCGLCQARCYAINVKQKHLLRESAIVVVSGEGREDRMATGSYRALREAEQRKKEEELDKQQPKEDDGGYLPDYLK